MTKMPLRVFVEFAETLHHSEQEKWFTATVLRGSSQNQNTWLGVKLQSLYDRGEDQPGKVTLVAQSVLLEDRGCAHNCTRLQGVQNQTPVPKSCCPEENFKPESELDVLALRLTCSLLNSNSVTALDYAPSRSCGSISGVRPFVSCLELSRTSKTGAPGSRGRLRRALVQKGKPSHVPVQGLECILSALTQINCRAL